MNEAQPVVGTGEDRFMEQAERTVRDLERRPDFKHSGIFAHPQARQEFIEQLAAELNGKKEIPKPAQPEEEDKPFSSDKFWNSDEPKQYTTKKL